MGDPKDSPLRKAEESAKRVLERLGSAIDKKVLGRSGSEFGADYAGDLASRIEKVIESSLKAGGRDEHSIAPNHFKVRLTYEEASKLTPLQIESLSRDLKAATHEFIHNRRYLTKGPIEVEIVSDLFASSTIINAHFDQAGAPGANVAEPSGGPARTGQSQNATASEQSGESGQSIQSLTLVAKDGRQYRVDLTPGGAPAYVGRAAGNAVRLDDASVSRVHCSIALRGDGRIVISDLDSANGTFVNVQVVNTGEAQKLESGDAIQIGDVELKVGKLES